MPAKTIAVMNMKGGVGKTTLTFNLASYLAEFDGQRVLLLDLDPQANATLVSVASDVLKHHLATKKNISHAFLAAYRAYGPLSKATASHGEFSDYVISSYVGPAGGGKLDIIPADLRLSSMFRSVSFGPFDLQTLLTPEVLDQYDLVFIDCAPTYSALTTIAFNSAQHVLIPMLSDSFGQFGTELMKQALEEHRLDFGAQPNIAGVVFTLWKATADQLRHSNLIVKAWPANAVFTERISHNDWYKVANGKRQMIWNTPAHAPTKSEFDRFVAEFKGRI